MDVAVSRSETLSATERGLQLYGALNNQVCSAAIKSNNLYLMTILIDMEKLLMMAAGDSVDSWKSKDKKIATVKKGKIKAVSKGKTTVTVTLVSGKKAKVKVTVK